MNGTETIAEIKTEVNKETPEQKYNKLRSVCWNGAITSFAFAYIFDKKAQRHSFYSNLLKVFGIIVPVAVGATALGYGLNAYILKLVIALAIPLSILQLIFSVFAVVQKWDDELAYAFEASQDLSTLSDSFKNLGNLPPNTFDELNNKYIILNVNLKARTQQNSKHNIKEWELRMGMRYALREFRRKCVGCDKVPVSMESTDCDICGKFNKTLNYKLFKP